MGWTNAFCVAALAALVVLIPGGALAAPSTNVTVTESAGRLTVNWDLAMNSLSSGVEIAHSAKTAGNGSFSDPKKISASVDESETTYTSPPLPNGTWYVHVASYDPTSPTCTFTGGDLKCKTEYSSTITARVGAGSPGGDTSTAFKALRVPSRQKAAKLQVQAAMGEDGTITVGRDAERPERRQGLQAQARLRERDRGQGRDGPGEAPRQGAERGQEGAQAQQEGEGEPHDHRAGRRRQHEERKARRHSHSSMIRVPPSSRMR
jgi:hypothetical protein